jgi:hypothetical protein
MVQAMLNLIRQAPADMRICDYFVLLCGSTFPIRSGVYNPKIPRNPPGHRIHDIGEDGERRLSTFPHASRIWCAIVSFWVLGSASLCLVKFMPKEMIRPGATKVDRTKLIKSRF